MSFFVRAGLATSLIATVLVLAAAFWGEYSARSACGSVGDPAASSQRADAGTPTLVDGALPGYQIREEHSIFIDVPSARVFDSLERDTGGEHPVLRMFDLLKIFGKGGVSSLSEDEKPVLGSLREGHEVVEEPGRELVMVNDDTGAVSLRVESEAGGSRLTTETRIALADRDLCRGFGWYWGAIYPGSSLVRADFLRAVKHRAETASSSGGQGTFLQRALDGGTA